MAAEADRPCWGAALAVAGTSSGLQRVRLRLMVWRQTLTDPMTMTVRVKGLVHTGAGMQKGISRYQSARALMQVVIRALRGAARAEPSSCGGCSWRAEAARPLHQQANSSKANPAPNR